jgi:hypothetical protein
VSAACKRHCCDVSTCEEQKLREHGERRDTLGVKLIDRRDVAFLDDETHELEVSWSLAYMSNVSPRLLSWATMAPLVQSTRTAAARLSLSQADIKGCCTHRPPPRRAPRAPRLRYRAVSVASVAAVSGVASDWHTAWTRANRSWSSAEPAEDM